MQSFRLHFSYNKNMKIVIVRHGKTEYARIRRYAGSFDTPLSQIGKEELMAMRDKYSYPETKHYYSSALTRAKETFDIIYADKVNEEAIALLNEHDMGEWEDTPLIKDVHVYDDWLLGRNPKGEEIFEDFSKRILKGIKHVMDISGGEDSTIVAHAGTIRTLIMKKDNLVPMNYRDLYIKNGMAYIFDVELVDDEVIVNSYEALDGSNVYKRD